MACSQGARRNEAGILRGGKYLERNSRSIHRAFRPSRTAPILLFALVLGVAAFSQTAHATPDFTISANPSSTRAYAGLPVNITITVTSTGGFAGTIDFSATSGSLYTTSFNPTSVTLSSGAQGTSTLAITADPSCPVPHNVVAKGTSGSLAHTVLIVITVDIC